MGDLFKTLTGGLWKFVYAWILPTTLAVVAFWIWILPKVAHAPLTVSLGRLGSESVLAGGLAAAFAIIALAILLALNAGPMSRLLEGYRWPAPISEASRKRQERKLKKLRRKFDTEKNPVRRGLLSEQVGLYPENPDHLTATRYGNAVAAVETYSSRRFKLDYHTFAYEFRSLAPEPLRKDLEDAEAVVNFFLALVYLSAAFGLVALAVGIAQRDLALEVVPGVVELEVAVPRLRPARW